MTGIIDMKHIEVAVSETQLYMRMNVSNAYKRGHVTQPTHQEAHHNPLNEPPVARQEQEPEAGETESKAKAGREREVQDRDVGTKNRLASERQRIMPRHLA